MGKPSNIPLLLTHPQKRDYLPNSSYCPLLLQKEDGLGGFVSLQAEHFRVHEVPLYQFTHEGEHAVALILKHNLSTDEALQEIATASGIDSQAISFAGRKDKYALTTQWIGATQVEYLRSQHEDVQILYQTRHQKKLKLGHLAGNLFSIYISDIESPHLISTITDKLSRGVPNYFGRQRFGKTWYQVKKSEDELMALATSGNYVQDPDNWASDNVDRAIFLLTKPRRHKLKRVDKLALSALQSALFNLWLGERIKDGLLNQVILGDVCRKVTGGTFYSTDPKEDSKRLAQGEIQVFGPLFGPKIFPSKDLAADRERALYEKWGVNQDVMNQMAKSWRGDRRSATLIPKGLHMVREGDGVWMSFILPKGAYATTICTELIQPKQAFERVAY